MQLPANIRLAESAPLKRSPLFGAFLGWPEDGEDWVHPLDIGVARHLLPGQRVFRREDAEDGYYSYRYGSLQFRARPKLWLLIEHEGYDIDDLIEVKSRCGKRLAMLATIREIVWNHHAKQIEYKLESFGKKLTGRYVAEDFQLTHALGRDDGKIPPEPAPIGSVASILRRRKT